MANTGNITNTGWIGKEIWNYYWLTDWLTQAGNC